MTRNIGAPQGVRLAALTASAAVGCNVGLPHLCGGTARTSMLLPMLSANAIGSAFDQLDRLVADTDTPGRGVSNGHAI
jgi:hypothetical protein